LTPGGVSFPLLVMTKEHRWTIGSIEEFIAHIEVDGRQTMHVPKWMLPRGAREGDVLAVRHEVTAEHSVLKIEREEKK
jgi:hypothetical protein